VKTYHGHINRADNLPAESLTFVQRLGQSWIAECLLKPVLAPLIANRRIVFILTGVAALQVFLTALGLWGWQCPIKSALGIPCPGCGLSSAMVLLIHKEWQTAMSMHAFAPVFLAGFVLMLVVGAMPARLHQYSVRRIAALERYTGFTPLLLIGIIVYWILRSVGLL
jgi:hypothetical protein